MLCRVWLDRFETQTSPVTLSFRQTEILEIATREGRVSVEDLARHFDVTLQTIRRDLTEMDQAGVLNRVHGGAVIPSGTSNYAYEDRRALMAEEKERIAAACAAQIPDDCSLFLNIGTTTEAVARHLLGHKNLLVATNNINVANILASSPEIEVFVTGGTLRRADGGLIGPRTVDTIGGFKFDHAVIGCSALDTDGELLDFDVQEVGVSQAILARSRCTFLVADHTKFERSAPARICSLADLDAVFTDRPFPDALATACHTWETRVHIAA